MGKRYLAIDIGASSGRLIIGDIKSEKLKIEEIYRFDNQAVKVDNQLCWNVEYIIDEIKKGLKKCKDLDMVPDCIGVDTWGLDFVLLDKENNIIGNAVSHRDQRTINIYDDIFKIISPEDLFERTGLQMADFNTICQLIAIKKEAPEQLLEADVLMMIPDYINYRLTGKKMQEYTNASTTQLLNPITKNWDFDLIEMLGLPLDIFQEVDRPNIRVGNFANEIQEELGFNAEVLLVPSHDTASAFLATFESDNNSIIISSGTWSLMGIIADEPLISEKVFKNKFTNEGYFEDRILFLKNIMGLWLIQLLQKKWVKGFPLKSYVIWLTQKQLTRLLIAMIIVF